EAQRRALLARHRDAVAAVAEDGLRMLGALAVPARVVANRRPILVRVAPLEAAEFDEPGARVGAAEPGDLRDADALPGRDGGPAFDAMVPDPELRRGQAAEVGERKIERPRHEAVHAQPPAGRSGGIVAGHFVQGKLSLRSESPGGFFGGELSRAEDCALHAVVEPLREPENALVWFARVTPQRKQREAEERPSRDGHARRPPVKIDASARG